MLLQLPMQPVIILEIGSMELREMKLFLWQFGPMVIPMELNRI